MFPYEDRVRLPRVIRFGPGRLLESRRICIPENQILLLAYADRHFGLRAKVLLLFFRIETSPRHAGEPESLPLHDYTRSPLRYKYTSSVTFASTPPSDELITVFGVLRVLRDEAILFSSLTPP